VSAPRFAFCACFLLALGEVLGQASYFGQVNNGVIKFKVSGRNFEDKDTGLGTSDPYVEIYYTQNGSTSETKLKRSETISNSENPNWSTIFEFTFDRTKMQKLHFYVWDEDDLRTDDELGKAWLDVNDYVDKGQIANIPVYKVGYLKVERITLNAPSAPRTWPATARLRFKFSATNLPDKDGIIGTIDPYAEIFSAEGITGKETKIGRTATVDNDKNPKWGEVFDFNYDATKNQRLVIKIYDNDALRRDEKGGFGYIELDDYMRHGQVITVNLSKRGTLTMSKM